jgi:GTPase Era involved in 16S rRNA processing
MRIAICGTSNVGKTTLVQDFLKEWPSFTSPDKTYRDVLSENKHSQLTTQDTQWDILNFMIDQVQEYKKDDKVIFDRCPVDNMVYTLWAHDKGKSEGDIDDAFVKKCLELVREAMIFYDVIFFIPITKASPIKIVDDGTRDTDAKYISEVDKLFKAIAYDWNHNPKCQFCNPEDRPAFIEIFGTPEERIQLIRLYLDVDGDPIENTNIMDELGNIKSDSGLILDASGNITEAPRSDTRYE